MKGKRSPAGGSGMAADWVSLVLRLKLVGGEQAPQGDMGICLVHRRWGYGRAAA